MHEMAICESIRQTLQAQSKAHNFTRVKRVCLEIGPLALNQKRFASVSTL